MRVAHVMAGARAGGAELFYERLTAALHGAGDAVLPVIRRDSGRAARLRAAGLAPVQLRFGGVLDWFTRPRLARALRMDAFPARLAEDPRGFPAGVAPGITGLVPGPEA